MVFTDYSFLFEEFDNTHWFDNYCGLDDPTPITVTEAMRQEKYTKGDVYWCDYPHLTFEDDPNGEGKRAPVLILEDKYYGLIVARISSTKDKKLKTINRQYNYKLKYWDKYGLKTESFFKGDSIRLLRHVTLSNKIGHMDPRDYKECADKYGRFIRARFKAPYAFDSWLKMIKVRSRNFNDGKTAIQGLKDIQSSKSATMLDIAYGMQQVATNFKINSRIALSSITPNAIAFCMFELNSGWKSHRFIPASSDSDIRGKIIDLESATLDDEIINLEFEWFYDRFGINSKLKILFTDQEISLLKSCAALHMTHKFFLENIVTRRNIEELNAKLNEFNYGCIVDGIDISLDDDCWSKYKTLKPEEFESAESGNCWDYVSYEKYRLDAFGSIITTKLWYAEFGQSDDMHTHTWLSYMIEGDPKVYAFESAWKHFVGIHEFNSEKQMIDWYVDTHIDAGKPSNCSVFNYDSPSKYGLTADEYIRHIVTTGKLVLDRNNHYDTRIMPFINGASSEEAIEPVVEIFGVNALDHINKLQEAALFEHTSIASRKQEVKKGEFYFYHLAPIGINLHGGIMSPAGLCDSGRHKECMEALDKYRWRMVNGWCIYPGRDPASLNEMELLMGLEKFRGRGGARTIYFFKYLPTSSLGKGMANVVKHKDGYRINLDDPELKKEIESISWGWVDSYTQNTAFSEDYYRKVTEKEYFAKYNDTPPDDMPRFAPIPHIGITFYDGTCPKKFLTKVMSAGKVIK